MRNRRIPASLMSELATASVKCPTPRRGKCGKFPTLDEVKEVNIQPLDEVNVVIVQTLDEVNV